MGKFDDLIDCLPHEPPALYVDEIVELVPGQSIKGAVTFSEGHRVFEGHLPGEPIVPGVILIEAMAQIAGLTLVAQSGGKRQAIRGYLAEVKHMRFRRPVGPDDRVEIHATLERQFGPTSRFVTEARVDGDIVAEGELTVVGQVAESD
jgi:3-hydroxyacyl-[acyl-carrier-protein] dehydratase